MAKVATESRSLARSGLLSVLADDIEAGHWRHEPKVVRAANLDKDKPDGFHIWRLNAHDKHLVAGRKGPFVRLGDTLIRPENAAIVQGRVLFDQGRLYVTVRALQAAGEDEFLVAKPVPAEPAPVVLKQCRTCRYDSETHFKCKRPGGVPFAFGTLKFVDGLPPEDADGCEGWMAKV